MDAQTVRRKILWVPVYFFELLQFDGIHHCMEYGALDQLYLNVLHY